MRLFGYEIMIRRIPVCVFCRQEVDPVLRKTHLSCEVKAIRESTVSHFEDAIKDAKVVVYDAHPRFDKDKCEKCGTFPHTAECPYFGIPF